MKKFYCDKCKEEITFKTDRDPRNNMTVDFTFGSSNKRLTMGEVCYECFIKFTNWMGEK